MSGDDANSVPPLGITNIQQPLMSSIPQTGISSLPFTLPGTNMVQASANFQAPFYSGFAGGVMMPHSQLMSGVNSNFQHPQHGHHHQQYLHQHQHHQQHQQHHLQQMTAQQQHQHHHQHHQQHRHQHQHQQSQQSVHQHQQQQHPQTQPQQQQHQHQQQQQVVAEQQQQTQQQLSAKKAQEVRGSQQALTQAQSSPKGDWVAYTDTTTNKKYYYNVRTKAKQWEKPVDFVEQEDKCDWQVYEDPKTKKPFYYNTVSTAKQWECPPEYTAYMEGKERRLKEEREQIEQKEALRQRELEEQQKRIQQQLSLQKKAEDKVDIVEAATAQYQRGDFGKSRPSLQDRYADLPEEKAAWDNARGIQLEDQQQQQQQQQPRQQQQPSPSTKHEDRGFDVSSLLQPKLKAAPSGYDTKEPTSTSPNISELLHYERQRTQRREERRAEDREDPHLEKQLSREEVRRQERSKYQENRNERWQDGNLFKGVRNEMRHDHKEAWKDEEGRELAMDERNKAREKERSEWWESNKSVVKQKEGEKEKEKVKVKIAAKAPLPIHVEINDEIEMVKSIGNKAQVGDIGWVIAYHPNNTVDLELASGAKLLKMGLNFIQHHRKQGAKPAPAASSTASVRKVVVKQSSGPQNPSSSLPPAQFYKGDYVVLTRRVRETAAGERGKVVDIFADGKIKVSLTDGVKLVVFAQDLEKGSKKQIVRSVPASKNHGAAPSRGDGNLKGQRPNGGNAGKGGATKTKVSQNNTSAPQKAKMTIKVKN